MKLKWHMVSQFGLGLLQVLDLMTNTVSDKWKPVVVGAVALVQMGLAYIAHHYTPDGQKL